MNTDTIQIEVPKSALVEAFLEKVARSVPAQLDARTFADMQDRTALLPAIGATMDGGIYAGLTLHKNLPFALVLLPGDEEKSWKDAMAWAEQKGGMLPSRMDALSLWQNIPKEFKETWYWTSSERASDAGSAWFQYFVNGGQGYDRKSGVSRCRAVRRVAI